MKKNMNDSNEDKKHSFSKAEKNPSLPLETETELLLKKMERMQKKKNNYKNVDVLENIYDTKQSKPSKTKNGGVLSGISNFLQNLDEIEKSLNDLNVEGFDAEGMEDDDAEGMEDDDAEGMEDDDAEGMEDDDAEGMEDDDAEGMEDDDAEGFAQNANDIYSDMYEDAYKDDLIFDTSKKNLWRIFKRRWPKSSRRSNRWRIFFAKWSNKSGSRRSKKKSSKKKSSKKKSSSKKQSKMRDKIKKIINAIKRFNPVKIIRKRIAVPTYYVISGDHKKYNKDIDVITTQIIFFIYSLIVVYISGNWFYLMCYRNQNKRVSSSAKFYEMPNKALKPLGIVGRNLRLTSQFSPVILTNVILCEFFEQAVSIIHAIAIYPFYLIFSAIFKLFKTFKWVSREDNFEDISKNYMQIITNPQLLFITFTLFIMICIIKFSKQLHSMLMIFKNTKAKMPDGIRKMLSAIIIFDLLFGIKNASAFLLTQFGMKTTLTNFMERSISVKNLTIAAGALIAVPIIFMIVFCIAVAVNFLLLRISGLLCVLYLYYYSYRGAHLRKTGEGNPLTSMFQKLNDENPCNSNFSNTFTVALNKLINFIFINLTFVIIICFCIWSTFVYLSKISNKYAAGFLIGLNIVIIIFAIFASMINSYNKRIDLRDYNYIEPYNK